MAEKPTPSIGDGLPAMHDGDVAPGLHAGRDQVDGVRIVLAQEFQRTVGEHDAEAPGRAGRVLLEKMHLVARMPAFPEGGEVEPRRAPADHCQTQGRSPVREPE